MNDPNLDPYFDRGKRTRDEVNHDVDMRETGNDLNIGA